MKDTHASINNPSIGGLTEAQADTLYLKQVSNLSDLSNIVTARTNLGLGSIALLNSIDISSNTNLAATSPIVLTGDTLSFNTTVTDALYLKIANNLSDLANAATARTNLGLVAGGAGDIWVEKAGDTMTGALTITPATPGVALTTTGHHITTNAAASGTAGTGSQINTGDPNTKGLIIKGNTFTPATGVSLVATFNKDSDQMVSIASNSTLQTGDIDFTIAGWFYFTEIGTNQGVMGKYDDPSSREYGIFLLSTGALRFLKSSDGTVTNQVGVDVAGISNNTWYFVVAWHDSVANTINIQINDGTVVSSSTATGVFSGTALFAIGRLGADGGDYSGRAGAVGFWKRTLTTAEKTSLYNLGSGTTYSGLTDGQKTSLISYWDLSEGSGNRADSHGTNTLAQTNTPGQGVGPTAPTVQASNLQEWIDTNSVVLSSISSAGRLALGSTGAPGAMILVAADAATTKAAIIKGFASQSANLTEWQNSSGTPLTYIEPDGDIVVDVDSVGLTLGAGQDAKITYDGTNMVINPKLVGTGVLDITGALRIDQGGSTANANVGGVISVNTTAVGNITTGEDDLMTFAIPASSLGTNGDSIRFRCSGTIANSINAKRLRVKYGATTVLDTGAAGFPISAAIQWVLEGEIIRTGAATQKCSANLSTNNASLASYVGYSTAAETLSGAVTLKLTGEAVDTNDVVQESMTVSWMPNM